MKKEILPQSGLPTKGTASVCTELSIWALNVCVPLEVRNAPRRDLVGDFLRGWRAGTDCFCSALRLFHTMIYFSPLVE